MAIIVSNGNLMLRGGAFMTITHDALIIGAGQAGPPLAGRLTAAGMSVGLIERKLWRRLRQHGR